MKILHLISQHPKSTGSGYYLQNIISQAGASGHENYLVAGSSRGVRPHLAMIDSTSCSFVDFGSEPLDFAIPGMSDVMPYESSRFKDLSSAQLNSYKTAWANAVAEAVARFSPDIIHTHHLWIATSVARQLVPDIPMVTSCHSTDLRQFVQCPHLREFVEAGCRKSDRVLSLGGAQRQKIIDLYNIGGDRIDIIGGGIDTSRFQLHPDKPSAPPVQLVYGGKISFAKGVKWLMETVAEIDSCPEFHLHLAGSGTGSEEQECLSLASRLSGLVTVCGHLPQDRFAELMAQCHIFVLPSYYEGLPLVLLEALGAGCRIVTTNLPGCTELLGGCSEDLVRFIPLPPLETVDSPKKTDEKMLRLRLEKALKSMIATVVENPTLPTQEIDAILAANSWQAVFQKIENSYRSVIDKRKKNA
ncbi:glycosyltransferase family 4 protein [Desulforhopalus singaporensis]|nr:glycosyltransferase family 4 protein [Desulforhopalus singaporensis]